MESKVTELNIVVDNDLGDQPHLKAKRCHTRLKIYREFALATLCSLSKENQPGEDASKSVRACDCISGCGIAGLQWKKHLQQLAHVTLADQGDLTTLKSNAEANALKPTEIQMVGKPGDPYPDQTQSEIHVCSADAKAFLNMQSFQFIFLSPLKNCMNYIEPAFSNVTNNGVVCLVVPDVLVFARSAPVVKRYFAADVIKTEYLKEMAARIVLVSMARAAARYSKGITPLYVVSKEDFLLVTVKVNRGNAAADSSLKEITKLLHCRICEERVFVQQQLAPDENPYDKLPCKCKAKNTGRTAVLIGPIWKGPIFNPDFLNRLQADCGNLPLSSTFHDQLSQLITESLCPSTQTTEILYPHVKNVTKVSVGDGLVQRLAPTDCNQISIAVRGESEGEDNRKLIDPSEVTADQTPDTKVTDSSSGGKRQKDGSDINEESHHHEAKRSRKDCDVVDAKQNENCFERGCNVPFYYSIKKCRTPSLPKLDHYVRSLQKAGHHASRTHFDPCSIRTSATVEQFLAIL